MTRRVNPLVCIVNLNPYLLHLSSIIYIIMSGLSSFSSCLDFVLNLFRDKFLQCLFPKQSLQELRSESVLLMQQKEKISQRVEEQRGFRPGMRCRRGVEDWLTNVEDLDAEMTRTLGGYISQSRGGRVEGGGRCRWCRRVSPCHRRRLGANISDMLRRVKALREDGQGFDPPSDLFEASPPPPVEEVQHSTANNIIGIEEKLEEVLGHLRDDRVRVIGIYGAGGIGKTTLMTELNNRLLSYANEGEFDLVIWATVSKHVDIDKIKKDIGRRLRLADLENVDRCLRANALYNVLKEKKFLILLDDLWERLDLATLGIPQPGTSNKGRIVFTTRSNNVCRYMNAHRYVKMHYLDPNKSLQLFRDNLGPHVDLDNNHAIRDCANNVVGICGGLPLALIVTAKAFGGYGNNVWEWKSGLQKVTDSRLDVPGMEDQLTLLKFSFDRLDNMNLRQCLLCCSLAPPEFEISLEWLTKMWIGEGLLYPARGYNEDYGKLRNMALDIVSSLKSASLLESGDLFGGVHVKLHDSIRDMCLWITSGSDTCNSDYGEFLVYSNLEDINQINFEDWTTCTKVSLMQPEIKVLGNGCAQQQQCPKLQTLLISHCHSLTKIDDNFFQHMPTLRVLDLTCTRLTELPKSVCSLVELRYLSLKRSKIKRLPTEIGNLSNLRLLLLSDSEDLEIVPKEAFSNLAMLRHLDICATPFRWGQGSNIGFDDLNNLKMLQELVLNVQCVTEFDDLLECFPSSRVKGMSLHGTDFTNKHVSAAYSTFLKMRYFGIIGGSIDELVLLQGCGGSHLEELCLENCTYLSRIAVQGERIPREQSGEVGGAHAVSLPKRTPCSPLPHLQQIIIGSCPSLQDLSCFWHIPSVQVIRIRDCQELQEILPAPTNQQVKNTSCPITPFPILQFMELVKLSNLKSIFNTCPLSFPSLRTLEVQECPQLKKVPFDLQTAKSITCIIGSKEWWEQLEWDDDNIKRALLPRLQVN